MYMYGCTHRSKGQDKDPFISLRKMCDLEYMMSLLIGEIKGKFNTALEYITRVVHGRRTVDVKRVLVML
jgi:hypothetical protein